MNILPKKKWHVRTKENIERVRRDEAEATKREKERCRRVALAEQEHRTAILRSQANEHNPLPSADPAIHTPASGGHVNLFQDLEDGAPVLADNQERVQEQREEQRRLEKRLGVSNCLSDVSVGQPWYTQLSDRERCKQHQPEPDVDVEVRRSARDDPLSLFSEYTDSGKSSQSRVPTLTSAPIAALSHSHFVPLDVGKSNSKRKRTKPDRKRKNKRKGKSKSSRRRRHRTSSSSSSSSSSSDNAEERERRRIAVERMRKERLAREKEEHARAERLLNRSTDVVAESREDATPRQQYSSQFNPHLCRQNRRS